MLLSFGGGFGRQAGTSKQLFLARPGPYGSDQQSEQAAGTTRYYGPQGASGPQVELVNAYLQIIDRSDGESYIVTANVIVSINSCDSASTVAFVDDLGQALASVTYAAGETGSKSLTITSDLLNGGSYAWKVVAGGSGAQIFKLNTLQLEIRP